MNAFGWLRTRTGEWIIAIGLVAAAFSLIAFTLDDLWTLFSGNLPSLKFSTIWYLFLGGLGALFSIVCIFIWRPIVARLVIALFAVSMTSHVMERFIAIPHLRLVAGSRLLVSAAVALLFLRYGSVDRERAPDGA